MKARLFYLVTMLMTMFAITSCSNDEFDEVMKEKNVLTDGIEILKFEGLYSNEGCRDVSSYTCYESESKEEVEEIYTVEDVDLLKWNGRTLVTIDVCYHASICNFNKKVYKKNDKYVIEFLEIENSGYRNQVCDHECYGVLLDEGNVKPENIKLKVGIYCRDEQGKEYYEYI